MKVSIVEANKTGVEHLSFNEQVLQIALNNTAKECLFFSSAKHFNSLNSSIAMKVSFFRIPVYSILNRRFILKFLVEIIATIYSLILSKFHKVELVVFLSVFPPLLPFISILTKVLGLNTRVILHGELEGLIVPNKQSFSSYGYWVKVFFDKKFYKNVTSIVLSKGIYDRLLLLYPNISNFLLSINHPVPITEPSEKKPYAFATIGYATKLKHGDVFDKYITDSERGVDRLIHIGMADPEVIEMYSAYIEFASPDGSALSAESFSKYLSKVKSAVFLYNASSYNLTVSGAMLDALGSGCRVVTIHNQFASDLIKMGFDINIVERDDLFKNRYESPRLHSVDFANYNSDCDILKKF